MEFPITELLDEELSTQWLLKHFHPDGLKCPRCGSREEEARTFLSPDTKFCRSGELLLPEISANLWFQDTSAFLTGSR